MKHIFRDALNAALQKLGFPWLTPHPTKTTKELGYFQKTISQNDLYEMYKRNQLAHNIVFNVAVDALNASFTVKMPDGEEAKELNAEIHSLYATAIFAPLLRCHTYARLYGSAGLLIGYRDARRFEESADQRDKIEYLFALPPKWVNQKVRAESHPRCHHARATARERCEAPARGGLSDSAAACKQDPRAQRSLI